MTLDETSNKDITKAITIIKSASKNLSPVNIDVKFTAVNKSITDLITYYAVSPTDSIFNWVMKGVQLLGFIAGYTGRVKALEDIYYEILQILDSDSNEINAFLFYMEFAHIFSISKKVEMIDKITTSAKELFEKVGKTSVAKRNIYFMMIKICDISIRMLKQADKASIAYKYAQFRLEISEDAFKEAPYDEKLEAANIDSKIRMASVLLKLGRLSEAFNYIETFHNVAKEKDYPGILIISHDFFGDYYTKKGELENLEKNYRKVIDTLEEKDQISKSYGMLASVTKKLSDAYTELGVKKKEAKKLEKKAEKYVKLYAEAMKKERQQRRQ